LARFGEGTKEAQNRYRRFIVAQLALKKLGMSGAEVARHLGVTTSCINRVVSKKEISLIGERISNKWKS